MKCPYCGGEVSGDVCNSCGAPVDRQASQPSAVNQPNYSHQNTQNSAADRNSDEKSMLWYYLLIFFVLFAGAAFNLIGAVRSFTGANYGAKAGYIYSAYSGLRYADIAMGGCCLLLAVIAVFARFALAGYKKSGPKLLYFYYILNIIAGVGYNVYVGILLNGYGNATLTAGAVVPIIASVIVLVVNVIYFGKRKSMFKK